MIRHMVATSWLALLMAAPLATAQAAGSEQEDTQSARYFWGAQFEEVEYRYSDEDDTLFTWDGDLFYGRDELKLRWLTKGEYEQEHDAYEQLENQLLVQTPVSDFFDAKLGVRFDTPEGPDRTYGVLGVSGLAPLWFEVDASLYLSDDGDALAELDAEYELLFTNYLTLIASLEVVYGIDEDEEIGVGRGLNSTEAGLRLSYDLWDRSFSPYLGVVHENQYGDTADFTRASGGDREQWFSVIGAKLMF
ncbi:copper resistance protein B [Marinobacter zhejiangensis]|uniref:Copper resistance protein B n=1 Tax=Marinobacter zhejiangensis TaxID=488535 RepID=A0A1I4SYP9_9GAMM|nr:copper resistance protein B [Marinobacter zhejiangensis]SFM69509.1 copper resistance protein B [Marinobacter zhejiangensis]